jgi:hypothetical protein
MALSFKLIFGMNSSNALNCIDGVPSIAVFWNFLLSGGNKFLIFTVPLMFSFITMWIYSANFSNVMKNCPIALRTNCLALVSIYPIVSVFSMIAIAIPRTYFFNDSVGHIAFMVISWQLYRFMGYKIQKLLKLTCFLPDCA